MSSKYWCENLLKRLFKSPNIGHDRWVSIRVSKEMVPQYLRRRSKEVVGVGVGECSYANYTTHHLPLFLNNKRIFIIVMVSWSLWESGPNKELLCLVYEQPNEVEEDSGRELGGLRACWLQEAKRKRAPKHFFKTQTINSLECGFQMTCEATNTSAGATIFSSMHVSGEQLALMSGIAAILRFPLPDLDEIEM
nr:protein PELOTA 1 [Ipomoea batatas]